MKVEVVYGNSEQQTLLSCDVPNDSTARYAIECSGILDKYPELKIDKLTMGVFSKKITLDSILKKGDRIEIYRPLKMDPKEARRLRSQK